MKVIVTGATGLVGEGVMFECLQNPEVSEVLIVSRKHYELTHPKLKELLVKDFFSLASFQDQLSGYDACFFCAGISSAGMKEAEYSYITYDTTMAFANELLPLNPGMVFCFVSGGHTDSTEKGKIMWARVKGKTENALARLPFKNVYNFRPGFMKPMPGQKNIRSYYKIITKIYPVLKFLFPKFGNTVKELALAMINSVAKGAPKQVLEVTDIIALAKK